MKYFVGTPRQIQAVMWDLPEDKRYELREFKEKRTAKENSYFHRLVGLLAKGEEVSFAEKKNELIRYYGNNELIRDEEGKPEYKILPDDDSWKKDEIYHYYPTSYTDEFRGIKVRAFVMLKGTSTYNTAEMAELIKCTRNECEGCGIPREEYETFEERRLFQRLTNAKHNPA